MLAGTRSGENDGGELPQESPERTRLLDLQIGAVTVEVNHVIGLALPLRLPEHLPELLEGGRAQDVQVIGFAVRRAKPLDQPARHRAKRHVLFSPRPADDQKDADLFSFSGRQLRSAG